MKRITWIRRGIQVIFFLLVLLELHRKVAPVVFLFLPLAFLAGNFFCGWVCPLGTLQEFLGTVGSAFVKKKFSLPGPVHRYAQYSKYLIAVALVVLFLFGIMDEEKAHRLFFDAYQAFYAFFEGNPLSVLAAGFLVLMLLLSLVVERPFCNYFCINSVEYAVPSWTRLFTIKRNTSTCIACRRCDRSCPMNIQVSKAGELRNLQCINCFICVTACPVSNTLAYGKAENLIQRIKDRTSRRKQEEE